MLEPPSAEEDRTKGQLLVTGEGGANPLFAACLGQLDSRAEPVACPFAPTLVRCFLECVEGQRLEAGAVLGKGGSFCCPHPRGGRSHRGAGRPWLLVALAVKQSYKLIVG